MTRATTEVVLVLRESEVRDLIDAPAALEAVRAAFIALHHGRALLPTPLDFEFSQFDGEAHVKGAYLGEGDYWTVKVAAGFYGNDARGLPTNSGLSLVLSASTGFPKLVLFDNGYLTQLRTAAAGALAADLLAPAVVDAVAIIGAGTQARFQLESLLLVRKPRRVVVASRTRSSADAFAREVEGRFAVAVDVATDVAEAVQAAELVVTVTPSRVPLVRAEWLKPGSHLTAVGADMPAKRELFPGVFSRAEIIAADHPAAAIRDGELSHAVREGAVDARDVLSLGALAAGEVSVERRPVTISVCDLVGLGVQDAAVAAVVARRATERGVGTQISIEAGNR